MSEKIENPIVLQRADPFIYRHSDGYYYFTASHPKYDRIILRRSRSLNKLQKASEQVLWWKHKSGPLSNLIWAPEIHRINGKWYVYFAAAPNAEITDNTFNHRMYVIENESEDPFMGKWEEKGQIDTGYSSFALDGTSFLHNEEQYYLWAQQDYQIKGHSNIYIARMKNPWTLETPPVMLTKPELPWEIKGFWVNEGPAVLQRNGKIFITYSGSSTGVDYCMGLLSANSKDDLLSRTSWTKAKEPVFQSNHSNGQYGPGHNSFTTSKEGDTILVYHARNYTQIEGDPLFDPNRHARAQKIKWDAHGNPLFGVPVPDDRWTPKSTEILK